MTHVVLLSDIDLARRLIDSGESDEEILRVLLLRGIEDIKAVQLVNDLREGRPVMPDIIVPVAERPAASEAAGEERQTPAKPRHHSRRHHEPARGGVSWMGVASLVVIAGLVVFASWRFFQQEQPGQSPDEETSAEEASVPPSTDSDTSGQLASIDVEVAADGLVIGGKRVSSATLLRSLTASFGPASRTNATAEGDKLVYAFDRQGFLVYSPKAGGEQHLLLHYEALGGTNGTSAPFTGTLTVSGTLVSAYTEPSILKDRLELKQIEPGGGIFAGKVNDVGLCFTYISDHKRLSLVEIDLK